MVTEVGFLVKSMILNEVIIIDSKSITIEMIKKEQEIKNELHKEISVFNIGLPFSKKEHFEKINNMWISYIEFLMKNIKEFK